MTVARLSSDVHDVFLRNGSGKNGEVHLTRREVAEKERGEKLRKKSRFVPLA